MPELLYILKYVSHITINITTKYNAESSSRGMFNIDKDTKSLS